MILRYFFLLLIACFSLLSNAQYTTVGDGAFSSGNFGPIRTDTLPAYYSRFAFIYPAASMDSLSHGDTISAISFKHRSFDSLRGNCNMRVFVKATSASRFDSTALNWALESRSSGMQLIYDANPKRLLGNLPKEVIFPLPTPMRWDTTGGTKNLEILVEYTQTTNQVATMNWLVETSFFVPGFINGHEVKFRYGSSTGGIDSITTSNTTIHPTLKIYHPANFDDLEALRVYSLGRVPLLMDKPDSIKAVIANVGKDTIRNKKVYLDVSGANTFKDSTVVTEIAPFEEQFVYFDTYAPSAQGTENIQIRIDSDQDTSNNSIVKARNANYNEYSHSDPFSSSTGGIGFNGSTGDFIAKFYVKGTSYINQIKVDFTAANRQFQLGVWDVDTNGLPGQELFMSDTSLSTPGTFIMAVLPRVQVSNAFFVGIRQTNTTNVAFSYQEEAPIRPNTFYFTAPAGDTNWTSFSPGFDFNFNIQPRLQVANDIAIAEIVQPMQGDSFLYSPNDSLELKARVINYGYQNQGSFIVRGEIRNRFNQLEYTYEAITPLQSGDTVTVSLGKISKFRLGEYNFKVTAILSTDSVQDNNSKDLDFYFFKDYDVAVDQIFTPRRNDTVELRRGPLQPVVRVINYGARRQTTILVKFDLLTASGELFYTQQKVVSLNPLGTSIIAFDTLYVNREGKHTVRSYTTGVVDSFLINDTAYSSIVVSKEDDIGIIRIDLPQDNKRFAVGTTVRPKVTYRNNGIKDQSEVTIVVNKKGADGALLYTDTIQEPSPFFSLKALQFKPMAIDSLGKFTMEAIASIPDDQQPENDTMIVDYSVVTGNDLRLVKFLSPDGIIARGSPSGEVLLVVANAGINDAVEAKISVLIEDATTNRILNDTQMVNIPGFTTDTISFGSVSFNEINDYYATAENHWKDEDQANAADTLFNGYGVRYQSDLAIIRNIEIPDGDTLELGDVRLPSVFVQNMGIDTVKNVEIKITIKNSSNVTVYQDTLSVNKIASSSAQSVVSKNPYVGSVAGTYTLVSTLISTDNNSDNNTLSTLFRVVKRNDLTVVRSLAPQLNENIYKSSIYKPVAVFKNDGIEPLVNVDIVCDVKVGLISIYRSFKTISAAPGEEVTVSFDSTLTHPDIALATAEFRVEYPEDQIIENDTLFVDFNFVQGLSVNGVEDLGVRLYPNPFINRITIEAPRNITRVKLIDVQGKVVHDAVVSDRFIELDINVAAGQYTLEIELGGSVVRYPILKTE